MVDGESVDIDDKRELSKIVYEESYYNVVDFDSKPIYEMKPDGPVYPL